MGDPVAIIKGGRLPEKIERVCLALDLVTEHEDLRNELEERAIAGSDSLGGGARIAEIRQRLAELEAQMRDETVVFKLRALPGKQYKALKRKFPPRKEDDGKVNPSDALLGVDEDGFEEPLLRATVVSPHLDDDTWRLFVDERLTLAQFKHLTAVAWNLNERRVDIPFSWNGSAATNSSAAG